jgi:hypothetical protein
MPFNPWIVVADGEGNLTSLPYRDGGAYSTRIRILSAVAVATEAPLTSGIVQRHPWIAELPHDRPIAAMNKFYFDDFSRR